MVRTDKDVVTEELSMLVVDGSGPPLLGRDWLPQIPIEWESIQVINASSKDKDIEKASSKVPNLQQQKIGTVKGIKTPLNLKEGATPTFMKARPVPYSLRSSVEEELKGLVEGIVYPVESSEWATPVVAVPKKDGMR